MTLKTMAWDTTSNRKVITSYVAGSGDSSFKIGSIAANVATVLGGFIILSDGRELATWNGSTHGSDISVSLLTLFGAPVDGTTYYLYIDLDSLGSVQTEGLTGRKLYRVNSTNMVLSATAPESINRARYVPLSSVVGEAGNTYETGNFRNLSSRRHNNGPLAINPKVYSLSQAVGSVGSVSQIKAGHHLTSESFPASGSNLSWWSLRDDATDGSGNSRTLTNTGSGVFTGTGILGDANDSYVSAGSNYLRLQNNPLVEMTNTSPRSFGGWFLPTDATPSSVLGIMGVYVGSEVFSFNLETSGALSVGVATTTAGVYDVNFSIPAGVFSDGQWTHLVATFTPGALKVYVNGKLAIAQYVATIATIGATNIFYFGTSDTAANDWVGRISNCFLNNTVAYTDADIRKLYASKITHGANVSAANQDWKFLLGSGVQKVPSISPVVDQTSSNTLYADFSDLDAAETVDMALLDMGMTAVAVPAVPPFDQTYTSNPSFPISHGLSEVPSLQVGYKDASNDWHWTTGEGAVKADSTQLKGSIQTYFDAAATHVRIRAVVGASPTGVKEATASAAGIVKWSQPTIVSYPAFNPSDLISTDTNAPTRTIAQQGNGPISVSAISGGTVTFTFNETRNYEVHVAARHAHSAGYTQSEIRIVYGGTATSYYNNSNFNTSGDDVNDATVSNTDFFVVSATQGQTLTVQVIGRVTGGGTTANHTLTGTVYIKAI